MSTVDSSTKITASGVSSVPAEKKSVQLTIMTNDSKGFVPCVPDSITWQLDRWGAPGKLTFQVLQDDILDFEEGNCVQLRYGDLDLFKGYVFTKKQDKDRVVSVTAYDQLRYFKNKDVYQFVDITASEILTRIAGDYQLTLGEIENTAYKIPKMRNSNETLFDIVNKALMHTYLYAKNEDGTVYTKKSYILYDNFGKICLKEVGSLDVPILIDSETAENFTFETSIDKDTYNTVKLYEDNKDTGKREIYIAKDSANQKRWGILQRTESINSKKCANPTEKAKRMLDTGNYARKSLTITNALGDCRVRAGSRIWLSLKVKDSTSNLGNGTTAVQMLVESVKHKFTNDYYVMDLTLKGGALGEQTASTDATTTSSTD